MAGGSVRESIRRFSAWLNGCDARRRRITALALYALTTAVFFAFVAQERITEHTPYNHFALLADAWKRGQLDLGSPPPPYAGQNDFAAFEGKWFITFPPFPALLIFPLVWLADHVELVRDGQFFVWLAGIGPGALYLALEKLRREGLSRRGSRANITLSLLFAFGSVYFFTAVQGTVWFAAHVVGVGLSALYLLTCISAQRPWLSGCLIGAALLTRPPLALAALLFGLEALRVCRGEVPPEAGRWARLAREYRALDGRRLVKLLVAFALPILLAVAFSLWHNWARFGDAFEPGYRYLTVAWKARMNEWGLFDYHYLGRNLGVMLTSLPWLDTRGSPFQINVHGLALWVTTPLYFWLLWPKRNGSRPTASLHVALWCTVALVAMPTVLYQNTGWTQFGYRFSNDYAVYLFALLAIGARDFKLGFWVCAAWCVLVNGFGAATFERASYRKFYFQDASQKVIYQPD